MASQQSQKKQRHILQQRCVHHITSFFLRNLTVGLPSDVKSPNSSCQQFLYFSIHPAIINTSTPYESNENKSEIFTSEKIRYCFHPTWLNINIPLTNFVKYTDCILRLWIGFEDDFLPALQWNVSLSSLNCIGNSLDSDKLKFHSNAIVIAMHGRYYSNNASVTVKPPFRSLRAYDFAEPKNSYSVFALHRLLSSKKSSQLYKSRVSFMKEKSKGILQKEKDMSQLELELEGISNRIKHVKKLLEREQNFLRCEKEKALAFKLHLENQEAIARENKEKKEAEMTKFDKDYERSIETKQEVSQLVKQLGLRRRDILSELSHIFPISCKRSGHDLRRDFNSALKKPLIDRVHTICNIKLPESENFVQKEDANTSVALGYTAQLLSMMSQFLLVPLRYPINPKGSHSCIVDHVTDKLLERERIFPLHVKGNKDRFISEYGVFLLNKNVAQLRYYCGLGTTDLRPTLENIKSLLEERLGAKSGAVGHQSQPIDIYNPSRDVNKSEKAHSRSPGDVPTPSLNAVTSLSGDTALRLNASNQSQNVVSPRRKRIASRRSDLRSLRGELFGSSEVHRKSPKEYDNPNVRQADIVDMSFKSYASPSKPSRTIDSIESINSAVPHKFTGLEEIGQSGHKKDPKLPYSSARAELLGKRANQLSNDPAARRGWTSTRPLTGGLTEKRSELFRKRDPPPKEFLDENFDSSKSASSADSSHSSKLREGSPPLTNKLNSHNDSSNFTVSAHSNSNEKLPFSHDFEEPEVSFIDPSKSHLTLMDQSDEELDLC